MFTVNTNMAIKMNRGDDVQFPLFVNNGTRTNPIRYKFEENDGCEVYFYLLPVNMSYENFVLKKTFRTSGEILTQKSIKEEPTIVQSQTINQYNDIVITLDMSDTIDLEPKQYLYVVRAKILTEKINSPNIVKPINREPDSNLVGYGEADYMILSDSTAQYTTLQITNKYNFYLLDDDVIRAW